MPQGLQSILLALWYFQPHVIEINCLVRFDPKAAASPRKLTVEELLGGGYVRLLGEKEEQDNEKEEMLPVVDTSLSKYTETCGQ